MKREDIKQSIGLILLIALFGWMYHQNEKKKKEFNDDIEANKVISVAYVYKYKSLKGTKHYDYVFIVDGVQFRDSERGSGFKGKKCIGKFYKIIYSSKNPNHSKIFLDEEVTDYRQKINAGFK